MKASREYKGWVKRLKSTYGGKNGVIPSMFLDHPDFERHFKNDKKSPKHMGKNTINPLKFDF